MANWPNITYQDDNDITDEVVIRHQGINHLQKRDVLAASLSNARWVAEGNYKIGSEVQGGDNNWYIAVVNTGNVTGNSVDPVIRVDDTVWKESPRLQYVSNRIQGQQNWSIPDPSGDPLVSEVPRLYNIGEFPAVNVEVVTSNAVNLRKDGNLIKGDSGILRHYARGVYRASVIDENTEYMGVKNHLGNQLEAGVATGVTKGNNGADLYVDVDLSNFPDGYYFAAVSPERGVWKDVSDEEALRSWGSTLGYDFSTNGYHIFESGLILQWGEVSSPTLQTVTLPLPMPNQLLQVFATEAAFAESSSHSITSTYTKSTFYLERTGVSGTVRYFAIGN